MREAGHNPGTQSPPGKGTQYRRKGTVMARYNVYTTFTTIQNGERVPTEFMVTGIEAGSTGGAEHRLLDAGIPFITNALAFEAEKITEYFCELLPRCHVYDVRDFIRRSRVMLEFRRDRLSDYDTEIEKLSAQIKALGAEIDEKIALRGALITDRDALYDERAELLLAYGCAASYEDDAPTGIA